MDNCEWNSASSVDSDVLSSLPPLVIWTSRRSTACPPPPNIAASYGSSYGAHNHPNAESGNQVATSEFFYGYNPPLRSSFSSCNTPISTSDALQDHRFMEDVADKFREQLPEFQSNNKTNATIVSTTAIVNPSSNPMTPAVDTDKRSQDNGNQTVNHPVSVSYHYTGHGHVAYDSEGGNYSSKSADVDLHIIGRIPVSPLSSSLCEDPKHHDRKTFNNMHTSESFSKEVCQLQIDITQPEPLLSKETDTSLDRQSDTLDRAHSQPGEKPLKCKQCDKSFSAQSCLITSDECTHPEEKLLKCKVCDKTFNRRAKLTSHGRVHSGEKPFTCKHCDKSFSDKSNRTAHERIHTGEKRFQFFVKTPQIF
ncbi:zinc finger protein 888-like [Sycon ciliatum]|uniref:zinc finger protein 888-like n=1 Tax=Sycon ciliatum TaxID=27933 RepID=UPI0031F6AE70